jgi:hypothetical protein
MARRKKKIQKNFLVTRQEWEESERGWVVRPDGFSYHLNEFDRVAFIEELHKSMPKYAPDEYSRVRGAPCFVYVTEENYVKIKESKFGIRTYKKLVELA